MFRVTTGVPAAVLRTALIVFAYTSPSFGQSLTSHESLMSPATIVAGKSGETIITTRVAGDLSGRLTLVVRPDGHGGLTGTWALVESHIQDRGTGAGTEVLVQRGTLKGTLSGGSAKIGARQRVTAFSDLRLQITGGTLAFAGVTSGYGVADGSNLEAHRLAGGGYLQSARNLDGSAACGSLSLVF